MDNGSTGSQQVPDSQSSSGTDHGVEFRPTIQDDNVKKFIDFVPDEYKTVKWVQEIGKSSNPRLELFKQIENKDKMLGQRITVPGDDATPEQRKEFNRLLGVSENKDDYKYEGYKPATDAEKPLADFINANRPQAVMDEMVEEAQRIGLSPKAFKQLVQRHDAAVAKVMAQQIQEGAQSKAAADGDFQKQMEGLYGQDANRVASEGRRLIEQNVDPRVREKLRNLDNDSLLILASTLKGISNRYIKEDTFATSNVSQGNAQSLRSDRLTIMQSEAYQNPRHAGHDEAVRKVSQINEQMRLAQGTSQRR